ncbi:hypothetical protein TRFO_23666 [Tritrichomonas foetus]|uniref:Thioredoxin domain-containing protein n=1 Tax=Tritrichomonas foetus TaxID=1144522 RepID=A0A1J4K961_9EUKA|nr:hypothetical protein TRFO_23666 [Tritrichomonas foetus]|eukprot:OHT08033.1 hypothetical protein TRFO_23666 [Tritrichomonas foetus]
MLLLFFVKFTLPHEVNYTVELSINSMPKNVTFFRFFIPSCRISNLSANEFSEASKYFEHTMTFSHVNCEKFKLFCHQHQIIGFPTFLLCIPGRGTLQFTGPRKAQAMVDFIEEFTNVTKSYYYRKGRTKINNKSQLDYFIRHTDCLVLSSYSPYARGSKVFRKTMNDVSPIYKDDRDVHFVEFSCLSGLYPCLYSPAFFIFKNQQRVYNKNKMVPSVEKIVNLINKKCEKFRTTNGNLLPNSGLTQNLTDILIHFIDFYKHNQNQHRAVHNYIENKVNLPKNDFVKQVMRKINYYGEEILLSYQSGIAEMKSNGNLSKNNADNLEIRYNIITKLISLLLSS